MSEESKRVPALGTHGPGARYPSGLRAAPRTAYPRAISGTRGPTIRRAKPPEPTPFVTNPVRPPVVAVAPRGVPPVVKAYRPSPGQVSAVTPTEAGPSARVRTTATAAPRVGAITGTLVTSTRVTPPSRRATPRAVPPAIHPARVYPVRPRVSAPRRSVTPIRSARGSENHVIDVLKLSTLEAWRATPAEGFGSPITRAEADSLVLRDAIATVAASREDLPTPDCFQAYWQLSDPYSGVAARASAPRYTPLAQRREGPPVAAPAPTAFAFDRNAFDLRMGSLAGTWEFSLDTGETVDEPTARAQASRVVGCAYRSGLEGMTLDGAVAILAQRGQRTAAGEESVTAVHGSPSLYSADGLPPAGPVFRVAEEPTACGEPEASILADDYAFHGYLLMIALRCWAEGGFPEEAWADQRIAERVERVERAARIGAEDRARCALRAARASIVLVPAGVPPPEEDVDWFAVQDVLGDGACFYRSVANTLFAHMSGVNIGGGSRLPGGVQQGMRGGWMAETYPEGQRVNGIANGLAKWLKFYAYLMLCTELDPWEVGFEGGIQGVWRRRGGEGREYHIESIANIEDMLETDDEGNPAVLRWYKGEDAGDGTVGVRLPSLGVLVRYAMWYYARFVIGPALGEEKGVEPEAAAVAVVEAEVGEEKSEEEEGEEQRPRRGRRPDNVSAAEWLKPLIAVPFAEPPYAPLSSPPDKRVPYYDLTNGLWEEGLLVAEILQSTDLFQAYAGQDSYSSYAKAMQGFRPEKLYWGGEPEAVAISSFFRDPTLPFRKVVIYVEAGNGPPGAGVRGAAGAGAGGIGTAHPRTLDTEDGSAERNQLTVLYRNRSHYLSLIRRGLVDGGSLNALTRDRLLGYASGRERPQAEVGSTRRFGAHGVYFALESARHRLGEGEHGGRGESEGEKETQEEEGD